MMYRATFLMVLVFACGPTSPDGEGAASTSSSTDVDPTIPTEPTTSSLPGACTFCDEVGKLCADTQINEWMCGRFTEWICIGHVDTTCTSLVDSCVKADASCDAVSLLDSCNEARNACEIEVVDPIDPSGDDTGGGGGGDGGGTTDASSSTSDASTTIDASTSTDDTGMTTIVEPEH